jgi:hypothetical protein
VYNYSIKCIKNFLKNFKITVDFFGVIPYNNTCKEQGTNTKENNMETLAIILIVANIVVDVIGFTMIIKDKFF